MDEDSTPEPPSADGGDAGAGADRGTGRHRPRRRNQWSMTGASPRRGLLARLRDLLLGRSAVGAGA